jgi:hypothetical protein
MRSLSSRRPPFVHWRQHERGWSAVVESWAPEWAVQYEYYLHDLGDLAAARAAALRDAAATPEGIQRALCIAALAEGPQ